MAAGRWLMVGPGETVATPYQWTLQSLGPPTGVNLPVPDVVCNVLNYDPFRNDHVIETDVGKLLKSVYSQAFRMARRAYNFRAPSDLNEDWLARAQGYANNPTPMMTPNRGGFNDPQDATAALYTTNSRRVSTVRVRIQNLPLQFSEEQDHRLPNELVSSTMAIFPNDDVFTVSKLYTSLVVKYFLGQAMAVQAPSRESTPKVELLPRKADIRIIFSFYFVKGPNWTPTPLELYREVSQPIIRPLVLQQLGRQAQDGVLPDQNNQGDEMEYEYDNAAPVGGAGPGPIGFGELRNMRERLRISTDARAMQEARQFLGGSPIGKTSLRSTGLMLRGPPPVRSSARIREMNRFKAGGREKVDYQTMKSKIYIRRSLDDFFTHSKACIGVPMMAGDFCFPMAFLRAQKRVWVLEKGLPHHVEEDQMDFLELAIDPDNPPPEVSVPYFNLEEGILTVFNTAKLKYPESRGKLIYKNEKTELSFAERDMWQWCAKLIHHYVEEVVGYEVDHNDLNSCLPAYAYVFQVVISIFVAEAKGERVMVERPHFAPESDRRSFVALLLQGEHLHAISHMREFRKSETNPLRTCLYSYCDFCNTLSLNFNKEVGHQKKCFERDTWHLCEDRESLKIKDACKMEYRDLIQGIQKEDQRIQPLCRTCLKFTKEETCCPGAKIDLVPAIACKVCFEMVSKFHYNDHVCYMKARKPKEVLKNSSIFVYDIESMQIYHPETGQYVHECILICLKAVYDDRYWAFQTIESFVEFLLAEKEMEGSTILAHNGGGYDHLFVLKYLETNGVNHRTIPRPGTLHKYLMVEITLKGGNTSIRLLDFMMMMTDSLRNIGKAFKLPVSKGDFPHRFSLPEHLEYVGPLPDPESERDWFGFKDMKNQTEMLEAKEYWARQGEVFCTCRGGGCHCSKPKWNFRQELEKYCRLDVEVLAGACKAYRDQALAFSQSSEYCWKAEGVDPFQYMTQSQIALALFTQGKEMNDIAVTHEKIRFSFRPNQITWMENLMTLQNIHIQHAGNSFKEYFDLNTKTFVDGFCRQTRTVYEYMDCFLDACPTCHAQEIVQNDIHPIRNVPWRIAHDQTQRRLIDLKQNNYFNAVQVHWSHEDPPEWKLSRKSQCMKMRDFFYGGRTEVFSAFATVEHHPEMEILHHDVCSLYPYVCSWKELPIGKPTIHFRTIDVSRLHPNHPNRFFGFVRIRVRPNPRDIIAILPERRIDESGNEKLMYDLNEKEGCWHTELVYLAMEHQYEILEVYEVWDWPPDQRSSTLMRGYMQFFLRMKQEAEGWGKLGRAILGDTPEEEATIDQKEAIAEMIERNNGGFAKPRLENVEKNPVLRQLAKIFLNCLWGKLCQKNCVEHERTIFGYQQYLEVMANPLIDLESISFRHVNGVVFKARYKMMDQLQETNRFLNIPIAASVTAHAQVVLMRQMFVVRPERVLYCDTDSIMFLREKNAPPLHKPGLGQWEDEHPGEQITRFWALAPKCYLMEIQSTEEVTYALKCKGVRATEKNREVTKYDRIHALIEAAIFKTEMEPLQAETMTIHPNSTNGTLPYGLVCTRYGFKRIQVVFGKRQLCLNTFPEISQLSDYHVIRLLPFGYQGTLTNELESPEIRARISKSVSNSSELDDL